MHQLQQIGALGRVFLCKRRDDAASLRLMLGCGNGLVLLAWRRTAVSYEHRCIALETLYELGFSCTDLTARVDAACARIGVRPSINVVVANPLRKTSL